MVVGETGVDGVFVASPVESQASGPGSVFVTILLLKMAAILVPVQIRK
jgi:hypothetical protein